MRFRRLATGFVAALSVLAFDVDVARADGSAPPSPASLDATPPKTGSVPESSPPPTLSPPAEAEAQTVFVSLKADRVVWLEVDTATTPHWTPAGWEANEAWSLACEAPCDKLLPVGHEYRLNGPGIRRSRWFHLEASPGQRLAITATVASSDSFNGGIVLILAGSLAIPGGLLLALMGDLQSLGSAKGEPDVGLEVAGLTTAVFGGMVIVGGIVLAYANAESHQTQNILDLKAPERSDTAYVRAPIWRDSFRDRLRVAPTVGIPILSRSF